MKHNYNKSIIAVLFIFIVASLSAQNIQFTFENAQNTNDGSNDFYEADIMIQTIGGLADFKLGSGQIYFNYNTAAFGVNVDANAKFEATYPNAGGYLCGQQIDAAPIDIYGNFVINDNTTSRVSWAFGQTFSSITFANNNVTATPTKLIHIKFQYIDVNEVPMVAFENDNGVLSQATDQFYTACGSAGSGAFETADCTNYAGTQFVGAIFDNTGAILAVDDFTADIINLSVYPNPTSDTFYIKGLQEKATLTIYDINGKTIMRKRDYLNEPVDIFNLRVGVYMIKIESEGVNSIRKLVKI